MEGLEAIRTSHRLPPAGCGERDSKAMKRYLLFFAGVCFCDIAGVGLCWSCRVNLII